jgi:hypothetical protein
MPRNVIDFAIVGAWFVPLFLAAYMLGVFGGASANTPGWIFVDVFYILHIALLFPLVIRIKDTRLAWIIGLEGLLCILGVVLIDDAVRPLSPVVVILGECVAAHVAGKL